MFCGSGRRGDEHVGQGTAAHLGGGALPASKVRSDLRTSPDAFGFRSLGGPPRHLNQLRVHLRNSEDVGVPFYTGLVVIKHSGGLKTHLGNVENTRL